MIVLILRVKCCKYSVAFVFLFFMNMESGICQIMISDDDEDDDDDDNSGPAKSLCSLYITFFILNICLVN